MIILIVGLPVFTQKISNDLNEFDKSNRYIALNTYYSWKDKFLFFLLLPFSKIVISFNGVTDNSRVLNWTILYNKKLIMQWMGTDALLAMKRFKENTINRKYIDYAIHFVDSPWQEKEVKSVQLNPKFIRFKYGREIKPLDRYPDIHVLSYIAQNKQEFYGIKKIIKAAEQFPSIEFRIAGMTKCDFKIPDNVKAIGWLDSVGMERELKNAAIFVRMTDHDGFSVSVIEAISIGAEVIWSHNAECVHYVQNIEELNHAIKNTVEKIKNRDYKPNQKTIDFAKTYYGKSELMHNYIQELNNIINK
ncbi:MAG: hypothetical protein P8K10_09335 [Crocinitomicaceae bacterium]|nr:hypothetical protein [Crocinitomicaceae bacterium]